MVYDADMNTHRLILFLMCPGLLLGVVACSRSSAADTPALVARVIEAYGGEKALRAVNGYHASGDQVATQGNVKIKTERWFARPDRLCLDLAYPDHHEIRLTSGADGWSGSSMEALAPANAMKAQAMRLQTVRLDTPLRLLEHQGEIEARAADAKGRTVLRVPIDTGLYIDYHIDPKSGRIMHTTTGMADPPMEFGTDYDDFKKVDGVLVPFGEVTYAGEMLTSKLKIKHFEWNPKDLEARLKAGTN